MTKVRSREECLRAIQSDSAWRKREIVQFGLYVQTLNGAEQTTALRAATVMLYAHWEGFVKSASSLYISHINEKIIRDAVVLNSHFDLLRRWKIYRQSGATSSKNPVLFIEASSLLPCPVTETLPEDVIDTESNLNSAVLKKIAYISNIDYTPFELKEKLIDEILLAKRNSVAHGDRITVTMTEYQDVEKEIKKLIELYQDSIESAVTARSYM